MPSYTDPERHFANHPTTRETIKAAPDTAAALQLAVDPPAWELFEMADAIKFVESVRGA